VPPSTLVPLGWFWLAHGLFLWFLPLKTLQFKKGGFGVLSPSSPVQFKQMNIVGRLERSSPFARPTAISILARSTLSDVSPLLAYRQKINWVQRIVGSIADRLFVISFAAGLNQERLSQRLEVRGPERAKKGHSRLEAGCRQEPPVP